MRNPRIQSGFRFCPRRLDDGRSDDRDGDVAFRVRQCLLAERFRVRVGVGPAEAAGPCDSGTDELVFDPSLAELFGLGRQGGCSRRAELAACLLAEAGELLRLSAECLGVALESPRRIDFALPAQSDVERALADQLLRRVAAPVASDVAGTDRNQVRMHVEFVAEPCDAGRAEQVDLDGAVER